jgi:hypothetical protein
MVFGQGSKWRLERNIHPVKQSVRRQRRREVSHLLHDLCIDHRINSSILPRICCIWDHGVLTSVSILRFGLLILFNPAPGRGALLDFEPGLVEVLVNSGENASGLTL